MTTLAGYDFSITVMSFTEVRPQYEAPFLDRERGFTNLLSKLAFCAVARPLLTPEESQRLAIESVLRMITRIDLSSILLYTI